MRFSIGAEIDNDPRARPDAQNIVDAMRPDGMIRSVHFLTIEHPEKGADYQWAFDNPEFRDLYDVVGTERVWELYMAKLLDDIEKLPGHIVGHFYVPANFGHWPDPAKLDQYENQLLDACASRGMAIEINTRYLYRDNPPELKEKYREAIRRLMRKAKEKNVGIAIGADAHSPKDQGNAFAEVLQMLDDADINEIVFPVAGRLARVALRATKEHLQKVKAQEPAPLPGSSISGFGRAELGLPEREEADDVREPAATAKTSHDAGPRKRASGPQRESKKPAKETSEREVKPPKPDAKPPKTPAKAAEKPEKPPKASAVKANAKAKADAPAAAAKAAAKPAAKAAAKPAPKPPAKPVAKPAAKPAPKAPAKSAVKTPAKAAAKSVKNAKAPVKKAATAPAKKSTVKGAAVKKSSAAVKKSAPAKKSPAKKAAPVKKAAPKKAASVKKKVSTPKRAATKKTSSKRR
jgi:HisJ family histidinol phosphate phosphatase